MEHDVVDEAHENEDELQDESHGPITRAKKRRRTTTEVAHSSHEQAESAVAQEEEGKKPRWSESEDEYLVELVKQGIGWKEIASRVKRRFSRDRGEAGCAMRWYNHLRKVHNTAPNDPIIPAARKLSPGPPSLRRNRRWTGPSTRLLIESVREVEQETGTTVDHFRLTEHWGKVAAVLEQKERERNILRHDEQPREKIGVRDRYKKYLETEDAAQSEDGVSSLLQAAAVLPSDATTSNDDDQQAARQDGETEDQLMNDIRQALGNSDLVAAATAVATDLPDGQPVASTSSTTPVLVAAAEETTAAPKSKPGRKRKQANANSETGLKTPSGKPKKLHVCPDESCGASFKRSEHLKRHWRGVHMNDKPFACDHPGCDKTFSRRDNLQQHMQMVHRYVGPTSAVARQPHLTHASVVVPPARTTAAPTNENEMPSPSSNTLGAQQQQPDDHHSASEATAQQQHIPHEFDQLYNHDLTTSDDHHHHHLNDPTEEWTGSILVDPSLVHHHHHQHGSHHSHHDQDDNDEDDVVGGIMDDIDPHLRIANMVDTAAKQGAAAHHHHHPHNPFLQEQSHVDNDEDALRQLEQDEEGEFGLKELDELTNSHVVS